MPGKFEAPRNTGNRNPRRRRRRRRSRFQPKLLLAVALMLAVVVLALAMCGRKNADRPESETESGQAETTQAMPTVVSTATIASQGDLLMHMYLFTSNPKYPAAAYIEDGVYNFDSIFQYVDAYVSGADYAVINLETTFGGDDYPYQGNPAFNCPDALADSLVSAGYDMLLTANNHCADTTLSGIRRTLEVSRGRGLTTLGTQMDNDEPKYEVVDVNGIRIGMVCYTYATSASAEGYPSLNYNFSVDEVGIVNYFTENNLDSFYLEMEGLVADMKADGAEATVLYIHWGEEYALTENAVQRTIAQKMCDLGIDVIVGGHPHVVQPMDLLTSATDPDHKTVCLYSMGNAVSNQRREEMNLNTGHTEDGVIFSVTFEKYSDGTVAVADTDILPTWVNKFTNSDGKVEYNILPLDSDKLSQWQGLYGLTDAVYAETQNSYDRTMSIVGTGLTKCQDYLQQTRDAKLGIVSGQTDETETSAPAAE